jgi:hypothetical protein
MKLAKVIRFDALQAFAPKAFQKLIEEKIDQYFDKDTHDKVLEYIPEETIDKLVRRKIKFLYE